MAASSSSASSFPCSYDVFLSFRGMDTRKTFTDHLCAALTQAGIHTFRDDDEIERGEDIKQELDKAIQESKVAVVVLSPDYASSRWCLDELVQINERRKAGLSHILPIFYHIEPSEVKWRKGSYDMAFAKHEERYKEQLDMVQQWKDVLQEVAALSGEILKGDEYEASFIQNIVNLVLMKLDRKLLYEKPYLIGIDSYVYQINKWLEDESTNVKICIVHGIGGIGKTTIATTVFNQNGGKFEKCCFLKNVRDTSEQPNGVHSLQEQILRAMGRSHKIFNTDEGIIKIKEATCCRKVLIVLDDLDDSDKFEQIIGLPEHLPLTSKIIITTRNMNLLNCPESFWELNIQPLYHADSFKLFNFYAFKGNSPPSHLFDCSERAVEYCGGLPLALTILAKYLCSLETKDLWESAIKKMQAIPMGKVQEILKLSFDHLENDHKQLFLHIACFFIGMDKDEVVTILDGCGFHTLIGIQHLINRCLITTNWYNELTMHQLVRDMGREIVRLESTELGKRSRIWNHQEAFNVLTEGTGTKNIKGLTLDLHMLKENYSSQNSRPIEAEAFNKMCNLQLLQVNNVRHVGSINNFPKNLVWLCWHGFPLKYIPATSSHTRKLVVLDMHCSSLHHLFRESLPLPRLKILNLSNSYHLSTTPDFKVLPNLERLVLENCTKLAKIDESIGFLERLVLLNLNGCIKLRTLPRTIGNLKALQELYLSGCIELAKIDESIGFLERLVLLNLNGCIKLRSLPRTIGHLKELEELYLHGCRELRSFPREMVYMEKLKVLDVDREVNQQSALGIVSKVLGLVSKAFGLVSRSGTKLNQFSLAFLPSSLTKLSLRNCNLPDDAFLGNLSLPFLYTLDLSGNTFHTLPDDLFKGFRLLQYLNLSECPNLIAVPEVPDGLEGLELNGCVSITKLPDLSDWDGFTFDDIKQEDIDMIHRLKLFHKDYMRNVQLEMYSSATGTRKRSPVKALREHGIFNFFHPGSEIPSWYKYKEEGSSISFVLEHEIIYALNICIVGIRFSDPCVTVTYRGTRFIYGPSFYAVGVSGGEGPSEASKDMLWLSCWNFYGVLFAGDEVNVSLRDEYDWPEIKSIGVHPVVQSEWDDWPLTPRSLLPPSLSHNHDDEDSSNYFRSTGSIW